MTYWAENWILWVSAFCVLAIYSYLLKDNAVYRTMMQVFIGINVGYFVVVQWRDVLLPRWWLPMTDGFRALFGEGDGSPWGVLWALVGVLGLLYYFQLSRKYFWVSRIVIGVTIGIGAGLTFRSQLGQNLPQVEDSFKPLTPAMVGATPRPLFALPGSAWTPTLDGPLAYFVVDGELRAIETLNGVQVWRAELPQAATGRPMARDGEVLVPTVSGAVVVSQDQMARPTEEAPKIGWTVDAALPDGSVGPMPLEEAGGRVSAILDGHEVWSTPGTLLGTDQGHAMVVEGRVLKTIDGATGVERLRLNLPAEPSGVPAIADFQEHAKDRGLLLVPISPGVVAYALHDGLAPNVRAGDALWQAATDEPVRSVTTLEGVAIIRGEQSSVMWQIPEPQAKLATKDYFDNWVFVITMLSVMTYFFFSFRQRGKAVQGFSKWGRWMLMIGFGAFFGNTVMTRMSYLLDRLMFLIDEWLRPFVRYLTGG